MTAFYHSAFFFSLAEKRTEILKVVERKKQPRASRGKDAEKNREARSEGLSENEK